MFAFAEDFWFSKTTWAVIIGILTAIGAGATGQMSWPNVGLTIFASLLTLFHRDAVAKAADQTTYFTQQLSSDIRKSTSQTTILDVEQFVKSYAAVHHSTIASTVAHVLDALAKIGGTPAPAPAVQPDVVAPVVETAPVAVEPVVEDKPEPAPVEVPAPPAPPAVLAPVTMIEALIAQHVADAVAKALGGKPATEPADGEADGK